MTPVSLPSDDLIERVARRYSQRMGQDPEVMTRCQEQHTTLPWEWRTGEAGDWPVTVPFWRTLRLEVAQAIALQMAIREELGS